MTLRLVGAGVGRTGTMSLKQALERLLGAPCYHMIEVMKHPEHVPLWEQAAHGTMPDWAALYDGYAATVDWPSGSFWHELSDAYPDAIILLSTRKDARTWWESASATIMTGVRETPENPRPQLEMWRAILQSRFSDDVNNPEAMMAAYDRHNAEVRATAPRDRLVEWQPGDGWEPLCRALGLPVPDEPFPHVNTREEFQARMRPRR